MSCRLIKDYLKKNLPENVIDKLKELLFFFRWCIFEYEIWRRSKIDIFNYKKLSKNMNLCTREYGFNAFYGLADILKKQLGIKKEEILIGSIEHGFDYVNSISVIDSKPDIIYAFGNKRKEYLEKIFPNKNIYCLSPYIQYVESYYSEDEIKKLKNEFGKTLLVMPSHSIMQGSVEFEKAELLKKIEEIKLKFNFKTVIVCLYWKDVLLGNDNIYLEKGYKICTAGHLYDKNFLKRLKSIILLSDVVIGNDIGTNIGYCICLNRPFYLCYSKAKVNYNIEEDNDAFIKKRDLEYEVYMASKLNELFGHYRENITNEQIIFVRDYWGNWK